jgi:hypothetical protein
MIWRTGNRSQIQMDGDEIHALIDWVLLFFHQGLGSWKLLNRSPRPFPISESGPSASHPVNNKDNDTKIQINLLFKSFIA